MSENVDGAPRAEAPLQDRRSFVATALTAVAAASLSTPEALHAEAAGLEIADVLAAEDAAWNRGDAAAFAARALPEIVFTNVVGMFTVGKAPFQAQHERIFSTIYKGSVMHQEVKQITMLKPDVAIVDTLAILTGASTLPPGVSLIDGAVHSRAEQVMVRKDDGWWVASFHNVAVNPMVAGGGPPRPS